VLQCALNRPVYKDDKEIHFMRENLQNKQAAQSELLEI